MKASGDSGSRTTAACRIDTASSTWPRSRVATSACPSMIWIRAGVGRGLGRVPQRSARLGRLAGFQQRLSLELVEVGILRLRLDVRVDLRQRAARVEEAISRDGARVARRKRRVAQRIAACGPFRPLEGTI